MAWTAITSGGLISDTSHNVLSELVTALHERQDLIGQTNTTFDSGYLPGGDQTIRNILYYHVTTLRTAINALLRRPIQFGEGSHGSGFVSAGGKYTMTDVLIEAGYASGGWIDLSATLISDPSPIEQIRDVFGVLTVYHRYAEGDGSGSWSGPFAAYMSFGFDSGEGLRTATDATNEAAWDVAKAASAGASSVQEFGWTCGSGGGKNASLFGASGHYDIDLSSLGGTLSFVYALMQSVANGCNDFLPFTVTDELSNALTCSTNNAGSGANAWAIWDWSSLCSMAANSVSLSHGTPPANTGTEGTASVRIFAQIINVGIDCSSLLTYG